MSLGISQFGQNKIFLHFIPQIIHNVVARLGNIVSEVKFCHTITFLFY